MSKSIEKPLGITLHYPNATWSGVYNWSDSRITYDGTILQAIIPPINVLFSQPNTSYFIMAPQLTRWRSRYRGQRESYKVNLEMQQLLFDIRKLYEQVSFTTAYIANNSINLEHGVSLVGFYWSNYYPTQIYDTSTYDADEYDGPVTSSIPSEDLNELDLTGTNDIVIRLSRLLKRVETLEHTS